MTTPTAIQFDTADDLEPAAREALHRLLIACADTKLLLGYHYGEWTFGTPELEAAVANCSLSQTELGHVRLLQGILQKHYGDDPDALVDQRPREAFASVGYLDRPQADWPAVVAMCAVVDCALTALLFAFRDSTFRPLRLSVEKMLEEERYHLHHGRGWLRTWAQRDEADRAALTARVEEALASTALWFGPTGEPDDEALVAAGVKSAANPEVFRIACDEVVGLAAEAGVPLQAPSPTFGPWAPALRRAGAGGPEEEILFHLRGEGNALFKLS